MIEQVLFATFALRSYDGKIIGTAFSYALEFPGKPQHGVLVTAKHVVEDYYADAEEAEVKDKNVINGPIAFDYFPVVFEGKVLLLARANRLEIGRSLWQFSKKYDLAFFDLTRYSDFKGLASSMPPISPAQLVEHFGLRMETVLTGFALGLCDQSTKLAYVRSGFTATHPGLDCDGLVTMNISGFEGDSGAPVLYFFVGWFSTRPSASAKQCCRA